MAPLAKTLTFGQRYNDCVRNSLGADADEVAEALRIIYAEWRAEDSAPTNTDLEEDILADFLLNYSHSRNPPCAPARTHGQIQAPREPPN
jgi:hypothetical protein